MRAEYPLPLRQLTMNLFWRKPMKRYLPMAMAMLMAALICGCSRSDIHVTNAASTDPAGSPAETSKPAPTTKFVPITHEYVIPEGATGPADVTLHGDEYSNYPEDKQPQSTEACVQVLYYWISSEGLKQDFDIIEGNECNAELLTQLLVNDGVLDQEAKLVSFTVDGTSAVAELSSLKGYREDAAPETVAEAAARTYCENLFLDSVVIRCGEETYGPFEY